MVAPARTNSSLPEAMPALRLEFVYDYMSRRCVKRVFDKAPFEAFAPMGGDTIMEGSAAAMVQNDDAPAEPENVGGGVVIPIGWSLKSTVKFVWDGWNLSAELDGQDAVRRTCAWGLDLSGSEQGAGGVGGLVFQYLAKTDATHHHSYDGNGNVTSLRDNAGAISAAYEYGPFGETLTTRGDADALAANAFGFSTKYADETGLYYYGYRYYNPGTGRWLNRDPIGERDGPSKYAFVHNNVVGVVDYLGLAKYEEIGRILFYSCNCGWIDTQHALPLDSPRQAMWRNLQRGGCGAICKGARAYARLVGSLVFG